MIVYSKEMLLPTIENVITLRTDDGYFYVYRDVYDDAVILSNRYNQEDILSEIYADDREVNKKWYDVLLDKLPEPIKILAPFILLIEEELDTGDIKTLTGALSVITDKFSVVNFITSESVLRKNMKFTKHIVDECKLQWMKFNTLAIKWEEVEKLLTPAKVYPEKQEVLCVPVYNSQNPMPQQQQSIVPNDSQSDKGDDNLKADENGMVEIDDDFGDGILGPLLNDISSDDQDDEPEEEEHKKSSGAKLEDGEVAGFDAEKDLDEAESFINNSLSAR